MYGKKRLQRGLTCLLATVLTISPLSISFAEVSKSETVYVKLHADGSPKDVIVTDWLRSDEFTKEFLDKTNLGTVRNVKNDITPQQSQDSIMWEAQGKDIYYQGSIDKTVPVAVSVSYLLDDVPMTPEQIAGKSGKMTLRMDLKNTTARAVGMPSGSGMVSTPFTAVAVLSFPSDTFQNVQVDQGKIFSDGNSQIVVFIGFPGLSDSLNLSGSKLEEVADLKVPETLTVTADVTDFEMAPIGIAASPELPDMIKDLGRPDDFDEMRADMDRMLDAKKVFDTTDPGKTIESLYKDPAKTEAATLLIDDIFLFYDLDKALLDILPEYATAENVSLYDRVHDHLKAAGFRKILDNQVLKFMPDRLTHENIMKSKVLVEDYDDLKTFRTEKLDQIIDIMDDYDDMKYAIDTGAAVLDKVRDHEAEMDALDNFSRHSREVLDLLSDLDSSGLRGTLTQEDIQVMLSALAEHKASQLSGKFDNLILDNGAVINRDVLLFVIGKSKQAGAITEAEATGLIALVNTGNVGAKGSPTYNAISALIAGVKDSVKNSVDAEINGVRNQAEGLLYRIQEVQINLQSDIGYDYLYQLYNIVDFTDSILPDVRYLRDHSKKNRESMDKMRDLITNHEDMEYLKEWAGKLKDMKADMDDNEENLEVLRDLLTQYDDPDVRKFKESIPTLRTDMDEARPIMESFADKLEEPVYHESLHKSPETVNTLLKMKNDLEAHRDIADILRLALDDRNVKAARDIIEIMDRRDAAGDLDKTQEKMDSMAELFDRKDAIQKISENYTIFTEKAPQMKSEVRFVLQTEEVEKPVVKEVYTPKKEEKPGFFGWVKQKVGKLF